MSHTWREELHAAGKRKRIPPPPAGVRMTSAELRLCEDLTESAQRADGQRKQEMEKQLLFFHFHSISTRSVMCQKNKSLKIKMEAVLRWAAPPAEGMTELCSFPPAEQSGLHP